MVESETADNPQRSDFMTHSPQAYDNSYFYDGDFQEDLIDGVGFADPGGESALRADTPSNPRNKPCPTCEVENVLTPIDVKRGYQCDTCADRCERGFE